MCLYDQPALEVRLTAANSKRDGDEWALVVVNDIPALPTTNSRARRPELDVGPPSAPGRAWG